MYCHAGGGDVTNGVLYYHQLRIFGNDFMAQITSTTQNVPGQTRDKIPRLNTRGLFLRALLILTLVWLPMADITAGVFSGVEGTAKAASVKGMSHHPHGVNPVMHHQLRQASSSSVVHATQAAMHSPVGETMNAPMSDCATHQAPCCHAGISFCSTSAFIPVSIIFPAVDRYRRFTDSLAVVILARHTRPPIV